MAYSKLTAEIIEPLIEALDVARRQESDLRSVGLSLRLSSVRGTCKQCGICHTTFYRWLEASRGIPKGKRRLTQEEKLLRKFGRAVDAYEERGVGIPSEKSGFGALLGSAFGAAVLPSSIDLSDEMENPGVLEEKEALEAHPDLSALEARTDELVGRVGEVVFEVPDFSLKDE